MVIGAVVGWGLVTNSFAGWLAWQGYLLGPLGLGGREGSWAYANLGVLAALVIGFVGTLLLGRRTVRAQEDKPLSADRPGGGSSRMSENMPSPSRNAAAPWLMIIDMQRIFGEPISGWATPDYASATAGIQRLLGAFESRICLHTVPAARAADRCLDRLLREVALCSRSRERAAL